MHNMTLRLFCRQLFSRRLYFNQPKLLSITNIYHMPNINRFQDRNISISIPNLRSTEKKIDISNGDPQENKNQSLFQRFKEAYAIYGKVVLVVHGVTSLFWFASVYATAHSGINLLEIFETINAPEFLCKPLRAGGKTVNTLATALILYKLIAPLRYGSTLILTRYAVRYLRVTGKAPPVTERDKLRNLAKESALVSRARWERRRRRRAARRSSSA